ncbi:MAG: hypothetical protein Kow009_07620 [Spirochaetales bacterium]
MRMLLYVQRIGDLIERYIKILVMICLGTIAFVINLSVFFRYVLRAPLHWSTELPELLLLLTVLFAAAPAIRHNMFTKVEFFIGLFPEKLRETSSYAVRIIVILFLVVCMVAPSALIQKAMITKTVTPTLRIPLGIVYTVLSIGFFTVALFVGLSFVDQAIKEKNSAR